MINKLLAQDANTGSNGSIYNPVIKGGLNQVTSPQIYFNSVIQTVFSIFFIVAIIYFIWHFIMGGYHWISCEGDPKKIETAKSEITFSLLGIFVVFSVFAVLRLVGYVLGISGLDSLTISWPSLLGGQ
jgi:hypothetical protein